MSTSGAAPTDLSSAELEPLDVRLAPAVITSQLDSAARRGDLPGYRTGAGAPLFTISDFGTPFESVLSATALEEAGGAAGVTKIRWALAIKPRLPLVFLVVLVATVWPGVWVTDSMLKTYFSGYDFATWKWYVPLTAPFVPWAMWTAMKRSRASGRAQAAELAGKVRTLLGASVVR